MSRGIDPAGNVANFVETEQLLEMVDSRTLYAWVTVRGSIPVVWTQMGAAAERIPVPRVHYSIHSTTAFQQHLRALEGYGSGVTLINLVDQGGKEAALGEAYEMAVRLHAPATRYVSVDYHALAKKDPTLSQLLAALADDLTAELWFCLVPLVAAEPVSKQRSVSRVNCVDWCVFCSPFF